MPLSLHHGSASPLKQRHLFDHIQTHHTNDTNYWMVVPYRSHITKSKTALLTNQKQSVTLGQSLLTWEDFLLKLVKRSNHRVHLADRNFSIYLIHLLIQKEFPQLSITPLFPHLTELHQFIIQTKSCGLSDSETKSVFESHLENQDVLKLLSRYNQELHKHNYFDSGDLILEILNQLKTNKLKWPSKIKDLYLSQLYPLNPGQRELLRLLTQKVPHLNIHLYYDEDFTQTHNQLNSSFEDLGDISDHNQYHDNLNVSDKTVKSFLTPYHELQALSQSIQSDLKQGLKPYQIAVLSLDAQNLTLIKQDPFFKTIPLGLQQALPLKDILPIDQDLWPQLSSLVDQFKQGNSFAKQKIKALNHMEVMSKQFEFTDNLLKNLSSQVSDAHKKEFLHELCEQTQIPGDGFEQQLVFANLDHIANYTDRKIYIIGLSLENMVSSHENPVYSPYLYAKSEFAELIQSPSYLLQVRLEKLKQLLGLAPNTHLSSASHDWSGKPNSELDLVNTINLNYIKQTTHSLNSDKEVSATRLKDFYKTKRRKFSITELQEYQNCPFRYYARYHLKLGDLDTEELEPGGNIKGNFVHQILYRLVKENHSTYLKALDQKPFRDKLGQTLVKIIQQELNDNKELKEFNQNIIDFYAFRVYKTIIALLEIEAANHKDEKKLTTPKDYEWGFGMDDKTSFQIQTQYGPIELRGRIDRIDVSDSPANFTVLDYKTGNLPPITDLKTGNSLQLPIYLMAVQKLLYPNHTPASACFYGLKENTIKGFSIKESADEGLVSKRSQISLDDWEGIQVNIMERIDHIIGQIFSGQFNPAPSTANQCQFCDYKQVCGYSSEPKTQGEHESNG